MMIGRGRALPWNPPAIPPALPDLEAYPVPPLPSLHLSAQQPVKADFLRGQVDCCNRRASYKLEMSI